MVAAHRWAQRYAAGSGRGVREVAESAVLIEYGSKKRVGLLSDSFLFSG